jgi:hypothetical protein
VARRAQVPSRATIDVDQDHGHDQREVRDAEQHGLEDRLDPAAPVEPMDRGQEPDRRGDDPDRLQRPPPDEPDPQPEEEHRVRVEREDQLVHVRPFPPEDAQEQRKDGQEEETAPSASRVRNSPFTRSAATVRPSDPGLARSGRTFPGR